ncbi:hypothetical protein [Kitasatospora sp. NPDC018619]|uniref:hypothetical protein n=1 Tax=unclassified Kitasatospora TaxID=2633591 RepID=UPI003788881E
MPGSLPRGVRRVVAEDGCGGTRALLLGWQTDRDGPLFGRSVDLALAPAPLARFVADLVQDRLAGDEFVRWPPCPGHPHPLEPVADGERAWWRCRSSGAEIGGLGALG